MKKIHCIITMAAVLAAICLVCPSCRREEKTSYLTVYGYDPTLSASDSIFLKSCFTGFGLGYERKNADDVPNRTETIFGNEVELKFLMTSSAMGFPLDLYQSLSDFSCLVLYDAESGKIRKMIDWNSDMSSYQEEGKPCTEEEALRIATEFAKEKWPLLRDNEYDAKLEYGPAPHKEYMIISFRRHVNGYAAREYVNVTISPRGNVVGWGDYLKYPDGIPKNILSAIETMDMELFEKSVVHYIDECAREASERGIKVERIQRTWIEFVRDGRVFVCMVPELTKNGEKYETTSYFYVPVSYDGQPSTDGRETTNMQNPISSGLPLKPNQTIEITSPAETEPEIVPPDTPENTDTISLDEIK